MSENQDGEVNRKIAINKGKLKTNKQHYLKYAENIVRLILTNSKQGQCVPVPIEWDKRDA